MFALFCSFGSVALSEVEGLGKKNRRRDPLPNSNLLPKFKYANSKKSAILFY